MVMMVTMVRRMIMKTKKMMKMMIMNLHQGLRTDREVAYKGG